MDESVCSNPISQEMLSLTVDSKCHGIKKKRKQSSSKSLSESSEKCHESKCPPADSQNSLVAVVEDSNWDITPQELKDLLSSWKSKQGIGLSPTKTQEIASPSGETALKRKKSKKSKGNKAASCRSKSSKNNISLKGMPLICKKKAKKNLENNTGGTEQTSLKERYIQSEKLEPSPGEGAGSTKVGKRKSSKHHSLCVSDRADSSKDQPSAQLFSESEEFMTKTERKTNKRSSVDKESTQKQVSIKPIKESTRKSSVDGETKENSNEEYINKNSFKTSEENQIFPVKKKSYQVESSATAVSAIQIIDSNVEESAEKKEGCRKKSTGSDLLVAAPFEEKQHCRKSSMDGELKENLSKECSIKDSFKIGEKNHIFLNKRKRKSSQVDSSATAVSANQIVDSNVEESTEKKVGCRKKCTSSDFSVAAPPEEKQHCRKSSMDGELKQNLNKECSIKDSFKIGEKKQMFLKKRKRKSSQVESSATAVSANQIVVSNVEECVEKKEGCRKKSTSSDLLVAAPSEEKQHCRKSSMDGELEENLNKECSIKDSFKIGEKKQMFLKKRKRKSSQVESSAVAVSANQIRDSNVEESAEKKLDCRQKSTCSDLSVAGPSEEKQLCRKPSTDGEIKENLNKECLIKDSLKIGEGNPIFPNKGRRKSSQFESSAMAVSPIQFIDSNAEGETLKMDTQKEESGPSVGTVNTLSKYKIIETNFWPQVNLTRLSNKEIASWAPKTSLPVESKIIEYRESHGKKDNEFLIPLPPEKEKRKRPSKSSKKKKVALTNNSNNTRDVNTSLLTFQSTHYKSQPSSGLADPFMKHHIKGKDPLQKLNEDELDYEPGVDDDTDILSIMADTSMFSGMAPSEYIPENELIITPTKFVPTEETYAGSPRSTQSWESFQSDDMDVTHPTTEDGEPSNCFNSMDKEDLSVVGVDVECYDIDRFVAETNSALIKSKTSPSVPSVSEKRWLNVGNDEVLSDIGIPDMNTSTIFDVQHSNSSAVLLACVSPDGPHQIEYNLCNETLPVAQKDQTDAVPQFSKKHMQVPQRTDPEANASSSRIVGSINTERFSNSQKILTECKGNSCSLDVVLPELTVDQGDTHVVEMIEENNSSVSKSEKEKDDNNQTKNPNNKNQDKALMPRKLSPAGRRSPDVMKLSCSIKDVKENCNSSSEKGQNSYYPESQTARSHRYFKISENSRCESSLNFSRVDFKDKNPEPNSSVVPLSNSLPSVLVETKSSDHMSRDSTFFNAQVALAMQEQGPPQGLASLEIGDEALNPNKLPELSDSDVFTSFQSYEKTGARNKDVRGQDAIRGDIDSSKSETGEYLLKEYCLDYLARGKCNVRTQTCLLQHQFPLLPSFQETKVWTLVGIAFKKYPFWKKRCLSRFVDHFTEQIDEHGLTTIVDCLWEETVKTFKQKKTSHMKDGSKYWVELVQAFCKCGNSAEDSVKLLVEHVAPKLCQTRLAKEQALNFILESLYSDFLKNSRRTWAMVSSLSKCTAYKYPSTILKEVLDSCVTENSAHINYEVSEHLIKERYVFRSDRKEAEILHQIHRLTNLLKGSGRNKSFIYCELKKLFPKKANDRCCDQLEIPRPLKCREGKKSETEKSNDESTKIDIFDTKGSVVGVEDRDAFIETSEVINSEKDTTISAVAEKEGHDTCIKSSDSRNIEECSLNESLSSDGVTSQNVVKPAARFADDLPIISIVVSGDKRIINETPKNSNSQEESTHMNPGPSVELKPKEVNIPQQRVTPSEVLDRTIASLIQTRKFEAAASQIKNLWDSGKIQQGSVNVAEALISYENDGNIAENFSTLMNAAGKSDTCSKALSVIGHRLIQKLSDSERWREAYDVFICIEKSLDQFLGMIAGVSSASQLVLYARTCISNNDARKAVVLILDNHLALHPRDWKLEHNELDVKERDDVCYEALEICVGKESLVDTAHTLFREMMKGKDSFTGFDVKSICDKIVSVLKKMRNHDAARDLTALCGQEYKQRHYVRVSPTTRKCKEDRGIAPVRPCAVPPHEKRSSSSGLSSRRRSDVKFTSRYGPRSQRKSPIRSVCSSVYSRNQLETPQQDQQYPTPWISGTNPTTSTQNLPSWSPGLEGQVNNPPNLHSFGLSPVAQWQNHPNHSMLSPGLAKQGQNLHYQSMLSPGAAGQRRNPPGPSLLGLGPVGQEQYEWGTGMREVRGCALPSLYGGGGSDRGHGYMNRDGGGGRDQSSMNRRGGSGRDQDYMNRSGGSGRDHGSMSRSGGRGRGDRRYGSYGSRGGGRDSNNRRYRGPNRNNWNN